VVLGLSVVLVGCANYSVDDQGYLSIYTLGVAAVEECEEYSGREDGLVKKCTVIMTEGFTGWDVLGTIASTVTAVFTWPAGAIGGFFSGSE
jgi:hypothetical protein